MYNIDCFSLLACAEHKTWWMVIRVPAPRLCQVSIRCGHGARVLYKDQIPRVSHRPFTPWNWKPTRTHTPSHTHTQQNHGLNHTPTSEIYHSFVDYTHSYPHMCSRVLITEILHWMHCSKFLWTYTWVIHQSYFWTHTSAGINHSPICTHTHTHTHTQIHTHTHTQIYTLTHTHTHIHLNVFYRNPLK